MRLTIELDDETAEVLQAWASESEVAAEEVAGRLFSSIWRPGVLTREEEVRLFLERLKQAKTTGITGDELMELTRGED